MTNSPPPSPTTRRMMLGLGALGVVGSVAAAWGLARGTRCVVDQPEINNIGELTLALPPDLSEGETRKAAVDQWTNDHPNEGVTRIELPITADGQHAQLIANLQVAHRNSGRQERPEESGTYSMVGIDTIWTDEFARNGWLLPLSEVEDRRGDEFLPTALQTGRYRQSCLLLPEETLYAVPLHTNVGLLYYRTDFPWVDGPPTTWAEIEEYAKRYRQEGLAGFIGQYAEYEGLLVNVAEAIWGHEGELVDGDRVAVLDDGAVEGLELLLRGLREEWIPEEVLGYVEMDGLLRFLGGEAGMLRNWPYGFAYFQSGDSKVKGRYEVAPLPGPNALGGANLAVTDYCQNKTTALRVIDHLTSEDVQEASFAGGYPPSIKAAYDPPIGAGPDAQAYGRFLEAIEVASGNVRERPRTPYYPQVTRVIQNTVHEALLEGHDARDTMTRLTGPLHDALDGR